MSYIMHTLPETNIFVPNGERNWLYIIVIMIDPYTKKPLKTCSRLNNLCLSLGFFRQLLPLLKKLTPKRLGSCQRGWVQCQIQIAPNFDT